VIGYSQLRTWVKGLAKSGWRDDHGAQLVEFAVALPLLVLFVVGIFDFSNAFTLKQKLTNIARDAARAAAADPANDLQSPAATPASVVDAFQDIDNYLVANKINDCGISGSSPAAAGLTWTYTATTGCPTGGLVITINRGYYFPSTSTTPPSWTCTSQSAGAGTAIIGTCVSIKYAYTWRFGRVASLLGATSTLPNAIAVTAVAMNEN
jgi:Flp pilus assembly protein TadG